MNGPWVWISTRALSPPGGFCGPGAGELCLLSAVTGAGDDFAPELSDRGRSSPLAGACGLPPRKPDRLSRERFMSTFDRRTMRSTPLIVSFFRLEAFAFSAG